jgi:tetratricopeptide (TPR) repeat protein/TolB-like protein
VSAPIGPSGWHRVQDLFHQALERDAATRADYIEQACQGDADLRREVESLIAAHGRLGSFIEEPAGTAEHSSAETVRSSLPAGLQIGPYDLGDLVGAGGMGQVYRARDRRLGREVALKILPAALAADPERRERFLREARMVSALNHPHICTIHEIGSTGGLDYICFEYIEGPTLASVLQGGLLDCERVLEIAAPLAEALAYAHGKGILHRDLKPSNIMVTERGPKILDFGLAKSVTRQVSPPDATGSLSDVGLVMGTAAYMSPEQALGRKVDERSDVFSLGAVLYEMATGKQAFVGNTPTEVLAAVLNQDPAPLARLRPELPAGLGLVIEKALRKDAAQRYQTMAELGADLRRLGDPDGRRLMAAGRWRTSRAGIAAVAAASVVIGGAALARWSRNPPPAASNALAVMYFENLSDRTDADNLGRMLSGLVTTDLAGSEGLQVVSSQRLSDIARQLGRAEGVPDRSVATDVARRAGAGKMVLGQVAHAGSRMIASAELVEVPGGRLLGTYRVEGASAGDVFSMAEGLGGQLRAHLIGRPRAPGDAGSLTRQLTSSADAYRAYIRGLALRRPDDFEKAIDAFRLAVKIDPEFALAHYQLSVAAAEFHHGSKEARLAAERAAALKDKLSARDRQVVEGNFLYATGRLSEALPVLEAAVARDPESKELLYLLSEIYTHSPRDADPRRAIEIMEKLLVLDPDFHAVYWHLGAAYDFVDDHARARQRLDEWESKQPETVRHLRSRLLASEGRFDEALQLGDPAEGPGPIFTRSRLALAADRWDIVREILQKHGDGPARSFLDQTRAHFHATLGEFGRAEAAYRAFVPARLQPNESTGASAELTMLQALAELLALKGDLAAAHREAERGLLVQPEGPFCLYFAGLFTARAGDLPGAERHLRKLEEVAKVARNPLVPHYRDALMAELALAGGRPFEAQPLLEKAVASGKLRYEAGPFAPGPLLRDALARTYLATGQKKKAAEALEALLTYQRGQAFAHPVVKVRAYYTLGTLKLDLGDRLCGRELLQKFLDCWGKADWDLPEVRDARARLASSS